MTTYDAGGLEILPGDRVDREGEDCAVLQIVHGCLQLRQPDGGICYAWPHEVVVREPVRDIGR